MEWILTEQQKPREWANVETSEDKINIETMDYKPDRTCMMAGIAGGSGYFSSVGFATDGSTRCEKNLICDDPKYWRYYDEK